jgi:mRNA interferase RelE/StbE
VSFAVQVYHTSFDAVFFKLPAAVRAQIEKKIDDMGQRLNRFPHHCLVGSTRYRLRVGDYRIIYVFDAAKCVINLLAVGHRKDIYR